MPVDINNSLLPGYTKTARRNKSNGYNSIVGTTDSNDDTAVRDRYIDYLKNNSEAREQYKSSWQSGTNLWDDYLGQIGRDPGSGPMVPVEPIEQGGKLIYPWEDHYRNFFNIEGYNKIPGVTDMGGIRPEDNQPYVETPEAQVFQSTISKLTPQDLEEVGHTDPWGKEEIFEANNTLRPEGYDPAVPTDKVFVKPEGYDPPKPTEQIFGAQSAEESSLPTEGYTAPKPTEKIATGTPQGPGGFDEANDLYQQSVLDVLSGKGGFPGTESAVSGQREAMAAFAKDMRAKAGLAAAKGGSIGQGTQAGLTNMANKNIMQQLGKTERDIAAMRAGDFRDALAMGRQGFESDRAYEEAQRTFNESLAVSKQQLAHTESEADLKSLEIVAGDNPVLLSKIIDTRMGELGIEFTPEEQQELVDYYQKKAARQEKLDETEIKLLDALPEIVNKQIESIFEPTDPEKIVDRLEGSFENLQPGDWAKLDQEQKSKMYEDENFIKDSVFSSPSRNTLEKGQGSKAALDSVIKENPWLADSKGKYVELDGNMYQVQDVKKISNDAFFDEEFRIVVTAKNMETGKVETVFKTGWFD